jgi:hypothetical protein
VAGHSAAVLYLYQEQKDRATMVIGIDLQVMASGMGYVGTP